MAASRKILGYRYNHFQHKFYYSSIIIIIMATITLHLASSSSRYWLWSEATFLHNNIIQQQQLKWGSLNLFSTITCFNHKNIEIVFMDISMSQTKTFIVYLSFSSCWRIRYNVREQVFWHSKEIASISPVHSEKKKSIILLLEKIFLGIFFSQLVWQRCV